MKKFLVAVFLAGVVAAMPGPLYAQPRPQGGHPGGGGHPAPAMHAPAPAMSAPTSHATMRRPSSHYYAHRPVSHYRATHYRRPTTHHVYRHVYHRTYHRHVTVRTVHGRPVSHVNARVAALRRNVRALHRFHAGIYRAPPGFRYRRWGFGQFLPAIYWGRDFWITDFLAFGLFAPPDGYIWVRYGPDAMLIDEYTGEILQVDYGVFF